MSTRTFWPVVVACVCVPGVLRAQPPAPGVPQNYDSSPIGPRIVPPWGYSGWTPTGVPIGGPYVGYPVPSGSGVGIFAFGASPGFWPNGLSLYGPPVPTSGPTPGAFGNDDASRRFQAVPFNGVTGGGTIGVYASTARPRYPIVPARPVIEFLPPGPTVPVLQPAKFGGSVMLSLRLPQPFAQVFVNGRPTMQTGTDRTYESPPLEAGRTHNFTVTARWIEGGQVVEMTQTVTGTLGEVVVVDFGKPGVAIRK